MSLLHGLNAHMLNIKPVAKTAILMVILTFGSKILGFIREMALAFFFGTSYVVDAYVVAYNIPNIIFAGLFVAIGTAYLPVYSRIFEVNGAKAGNVFTSQIINMLLVLSIVCTIIGITISDKIVSIFAPGFSSETAKLTSFFLRITFSFTLLTSLMSLFDNYLHYKNVFLPQILADYAQNISVIIAIVIGAKYGSRLIIFGLLSGYAIKCVVHYLVAIRKDFRYAINRRGTFNTLTAIIPLAIPVFLGTTIQEINVFVDRFMASGLAEGSVSALNYANQVNMLVITVSVTIITTLVYPKLAQANSTRNIERFGNILQKGFNLILIIAIPCSLGAIVYGKEIITLIYKRGAFDLNATLMTSRAYVFFSIGLTFLALNDYVTRAYYALHNMRSPMYFAAISITINITLNFIFVGPLKHAGLALSSSIAAFCNCILLVVSFSRKYREYRLVESTRKLLVVILCAATSIGISYFIFLLLIAGSRITSSWSFFMILPIAAFLYWLLLKVFKINEIMYMFQETKT